MKECGASYDTCFRRRRASPHQSPFGYNTFGGLEQSSHYRVDSRVSCESISLYKLIVIPREQEGVRRRDIIYIEVTHLVKKTDHCVNKNSTICTSDLNVS
jgi:hypothetical protein